MAWCEGDNDSREPNQDANNERPARGTLWGDLEIKEHVTAAKFIS